MTLWLNRQDVQSILTMPKAIEAVENAFRELAQGQALMPQRVGFAGNGGGGAAMPAYIAGETDGLAVKIVTLFGGNAAKKLPAVMATMLLLDAQSGALLAVIDAGYLTAVRTGAAGGAAAKYLAREDARVATIFGAGIQARTQLEALSVVRDLEKVWVVDPIPEAAARFADEMSRKLDLEIVVASDVRQAVEAADIIVTATSAAEPVFDGTWLKPGVHINGIGSHSPRARELDTETMLRARIIADKRSACLAEAGDLLIPIQQWALAEESISAELGEILSGQKQGRWNEEEITLFKSVGLAVQDVAVAALVYREASLAGLGQKLN